MYTIWEPYETIPNMNFVIYLFILLCYYFLHLFILQTIYIILQIQTYHS